MNAIEIHRLTKRFGNRTAVDQLDLTFGEGEVFALHRPKRRRQNNHNSYVVLPAPAN